MTAVPKFLKEPWVLQYESNYIILNTKCVFVTYEDNK